MSKEAYCTILGVKSDRTREVLAIVNFPTKSARGWEEEHRALQKRGLEEVGLVVANGLSGLDEAVVRVLGSVPFQKCVVHLERNVLSRIKPGDKKAVGNGEVFLTDKKDDGPEKGWNRWEEFIEKWKNVPFA